MRFPTNLLFADRTVTITVTFDTMIYYKYDINSSTSYMITLLPYYGLLHYIIT